MTQSYTAAEMAERIGATLQGDPALRLSGVAALEQAGPGDIAFYADSKFAERLRDSDAGAVIVAKPEEDLDKVQLVAPDPYLALRGAILTFHRLVPELRPGVAATAVVDPTALVDSTAEVGHHVVVAAGAKVGAGSCVSAGGYVGPGSVIGRDCYLYPRVTIYGKVTIGDRVILHSGVVLGADGFGYARSDDGALKVPQIGGVLIEDDVEIGANTTVDRATLGQTRVGKGTKIDNLVMVAHNVEIGRHCLIVSQTGIAGSSRLGDGVITAGQVGIVDHVDIGSGAILAAQSGVAGDVPAGKIYMGSPARDHSQQKRIFAYLTKLPDWARRLRAMEEKMAGLSPETQPAAEDS